MERHELTEAQWRRLEPLLPPERGRVGRPANEHRPIINGIRWILRTGAPWRDLPERYGNWSSVHSRYRRWRLSGLWDRILAALQAQAEAAGQLDWSLHFVDGTTVRAHQHAAGAKKGAAIKRSGAVAAASARKSTCGSSARAG